MLKSILSAGVLFAFLGGLSVAAGAESRPSNDLGTSEAAMVDQWEGNYHDLPTQYEFYSEALQARNAYRRQHPHQAANVVMYPSGKYVVRVFD
jgi:hypothetical protein